MMKTIKTLFLTLITLTGAIYQGIAQNFEQTAGGVKTIVNGVTTEVQFYNPTTVRIVKHPEGREFAKTSLSVVATPEKVDFTAQKRGNTLRLESSTLRVDVDMRTGVIAFFTRSGKSLLKEKSSATFTPMDDAGRPSFEVYQPFILEAGEAIYGLGQLQNGQMSQRGITKRLIQENIEDVVTFVQSVKGYGLFWDNYSPTLFTDNASETSFRSEVGDGVDYYFMYGADADGVVAEMRELTGDVPMFPLWTYGYFQSRERYRSAQEVVATVKRYRDIGVPLDGIVQDWQYWGTTNYQWNAMEFLNEEFRNPERMMKEVHDMNARMIISVWPSLGPVTKPFRAMEPKGMILDFKTYPPFGPNEDYPSGVRNYDAYDPEAREIYWHYLDEGIFKLGMDGWWMDATEPEHLYARPEDMDIQTALGSFRSVRNAYPLLSVGGVYDRQRATSEDKRVFILTRSAFAGQQRYGANTWTGDVQAGWDVLRRQIPAGLNFTLTGIPHWNTDIGGFFLHNYPRKLADPDYRELYARWLQFGTFSPLMRSHGTDAPREIWQFGEKGQPVYDAIEKYINLRYDLLPYIYSVSWDVTARRGSIMRALAMDFAADKKTWNIADEYMFGSALLVAPVAEGMYTRVVSGEGNNVVREEDFTATGSREVYLPKGTMWYDFWTDEKFTGGQTILRQTPIDVIPLYVRVGAIVPFGPDVQWAEEKPWSEIEIRVWTGADGSFVLYEDEGDNYNYEQGKYSEITFEWDDSQRTLTISNRKGEFDGMLAAREFNIVAVGADGRSLPRSVRYNGEKVTVKL